MTVMDAWKDTNRMYRIVKLMEFTSQQPAPTNYFSGLIADEEHCALPMSAKHQVGNPTGLTLPFHMRSMPPDFCLLQDALRGLLPAK